MSPDLRHPAPLIWSTLPPLSFICSGLGCFNSSVTRLFAQMPLGPSGSQTRLWRAALTIYCPDPISEGSAWSEGGCGGGWKESRPLAAGAHSWRRGSDAARGFLLQMCLLFLLPSTRQIYIRTERRCRALTGSVLDLTAWSVVSQCGTYQNLEGRPHFLSSVFFFLSK